MDKPVKQAKYAYVYSDLIDYIEKKYKIQTRGYKREVDGVYRDFWHWLLDKTWCEMHNGSYQYLPIKDILTDEEWLKAPDWVREIAQLIFNEYGEDEMECYVWW